MTDGLEVALRAADTVVFDFDGVLADSEPLHLRSYRELMAADGEGVEEDTFRNLIGRKEREIWPILAGPECDLDSLVARRAQLMLDLTEREGLLLDPGSARMLQWAGRERILLSSGSPVLVKVRGEGPGWGTCRRPVHPELPRAYILKSPACTSSASHSTGRRSRPIPSW